MKDVDLAYYAGLVDGEGSIVIYLHNKTKNVRGYRYILHMAISNNDREIFEPLKAEFGGCISKWPCPPELLGKRLDHWRFGISQRKCASFLEQLAPYLRIKRKQAELALEFQRHMQPNATHAKILTDEEHRIRESFSERMRALNGQHSRRGETNRRKLDSQTSTKSS